MTRSKSSPGESTPQTQPPSSFQDADRAARALRRAVMMLNDVHGGGAGAALLAPLLQELAQIAHVRGLDVDALVRQAISQAGTAEPAGSSGSSSTRLNARLFHALTRASIEMLDLSRSEMEPGPMSEELFKMMLGAAVYEELSASPRDPDKHLTAELPRDAVLGLMYQLASRRQHAEEYHQREQADLRGDLDAEIARVASHLGELGCRADVDLAMGFGIALWTPTEAQALSGVAGLCLTLGRSVVDSRASDYVVRFDPEHRPAAQRAADTLYRAHLAQRRRPRDELIDLGGVLYEQHPLHRGEIAEAFAGSPIDAAVLRSVAPRFATLTYAERATTKLQRSRFTPVGESEHPHAGPASRTRH